MSITRLTGPSAPQYIIDEIEWRRNTWKAQAGRLGSANEKRLGILASFSSNTTQVRQHLSRPRLAQMRRHLFILLTYRNRIKKAAESAFKLNKIMGRFVIGALTNPYHTGDTWLLLVVIYDMGFRISKRQDGWRFVRKQLQWRRHFVKRRETHLRIQKFPTLPCVMMCLQAGKKFFQNHVPFGILI